MSEMSLGVYWGEHALYFIEVMDSIPARLLSVPFVDETTQVKGMSFNTEGMQLISKTQEAFTASNITSSTAYLSLPTKDIIFRSFTIPWMPANEIRGVVDFEASKYIPFSLEELSFSYHPITITQEGNKRIRIIFVAIKKETLDGYINVLNQVGLNVDVVEPESLSLIRALVKHNLIPEEGMIALAEQHTDSGKIIVLDQKVPQFVREFQLSSAQDEAGRKKTLTQLTNEIKISLDYFSRQGNTAKTSNILFLSSEQTAETAQLLTTELECAVAPIEFANILGQHETADLQMLNAYGASLLQSTDLPANFFLSGKKPKKIIKFKKSSAKNAAGYKNVLITAVVCTAAIAATFFSLKGSAAKPKKRIQIIEQQLGPFKGASTEKIRKDNANLNAKLASLKDLHVKSEVHIFLTLLPDLLPEGVWIRDLNVGYDKGKPEINFSGYAYLENTTEQFGLINKMIKGLNGHKDFSAYFKDIDLLSFRAESFEGYPVTSFKVRCK